MNAGYYGVLALLLIVLGAGMVSAAEDPFSAANALYSKSVDLANEGQYEQALAAADEALAYNVTSLNHLIQANRAGILNMLGRYNEAISAADAALAVEGNLTATHAAAYYNKGEALYNLGRTEEAQASFKKAHALDSSFPLPLDITPGPASTAPVSSVPVYPSPTRSPVPPALTLAGVALAFALAGAGKIQ